MFVSPSTRRQALGLVVTSVLCVCLAVVCDVRAGIQGDKTDGKSDMDAFQGNWSVSKITKDGTDIGEEFLKEVKINCTKDKLTLSLQGIEKKATFKLDPAKKPKQIDVKYDEGDEAGFGIYKIKDDTITICASDKEANRPKDFDAKDAVTIVLKRSSDKESPVSALVQGDKGDKGEKKDKLQGTWVLTEGTKGGQPAPAEFIGKMKISFTSGKMEIEMPDKSIQGTYKIVDDKAKPAQLDLTANDDKKLVGIFEIKGDVLKLCVASDGQPRPTQFKSEAGTSTTYLVFKLEKADKEDKKQNVSFLEPAQDKDKKKSKSDKDLIQGSWTVESAIDDGMEIPKELRSSVLFIVKGDNIEVKIGDASPLKGTFTIDESKKPKQMDFKHDEGKLIGIYEFKGDATVTICLVEGDKDRPKEFKAPEGSGCKLVTLKRSEKAKKDADKLELPEEIQPQYIAFLDEQDKKTEEKQPPKTQEKKEEAKQTKKLTDAQKLVGTWKFVKARSEGADMQSDLTSSVRLTFEADGKIKVKGTPNGDENGTYQLDAGKGFLDLTSDATKDQVIGIYKFEGDKLTLCFSGGKGSERPKEFNAEQNSKQILFVLERVSLEVAGGPDAGRGQDANNLKQIALAFHNYHDTFKGLPAHAIYSKDGKKALLSWRVAILPFIEQNNLYMQFKLDEPWDSEHNKKLIPMMPRVYMPLGMGKKDKMDDGKTYYVVFTGPNTPFDGNKMMMFQMFTDGTSNTGLIFEAKDPVIWTKPDDLVLPKPGEKLPELGGMFKSGMNMAFADGSVRWTRRDIEPATLRALITPAGGEVIDMSKLNAPAAEAQEPDPPPPPKTKEAPKKEADKKEAPPKEGGDNAARNRSVSNLKQIGLAFHNYHDTIKGFPAQAITKDGKALLSWRVAILPFIEQEELYKQFKLDEPWDSEHNRKLIAKMPRIYAPVANGPKEAGRTFYQVFTGPDTLYPSPDAKPRLASITDGLSNTCLVFEANDAVIWTKPDDLVLPKMGEKLPVLGGMFKDGMNVLMGDGSVHWVRRDIDADSLRALITPRGGEVIDVDRFLAEKK
jgi:uncharacterized protein (TIGR03067 family)/prepilin-type processing-associated H-X9-DG protein